MEIDEIKKQFRELDIAKYPKLSERGLLRDQIYREKMGPGGLFLASEMCSLIENHLKPGMRVLDLGCGRATTSIFISQTYGAIVYAVDLWVSANDLFSEISRENCENRVLPFNLDATKVLPFPVDYFDTIFCMDAFHYFGADEGFLQRISAHLKPDGQFIVGNPCFDREFEGEIPPVYRDFWTDEFSKYHSPAWWKNLFERSGLFGDIKSAEAVDGVILWEDDILYDLSTGNERAGRIHADADEIVFGHQNPQYPYLTHYILSAKRLVQDRSVN